MFHHPSFDAHEEVVYAADRASGLHAIVAIHDTTRGPALGGCRVAAYATDDAALTDVLRLSRGMTYKSAMAELPLGGGKSVVILPSGQRRTPALFEALGRVVDRLGGRYIAAEDVGTTPADMAAMRRTTRHVTGLDPVDGGSGDPSPTTARGVFIAMRVTAKAALGSADLAGVRVAVQGLGHVGFALAERVAAAGARLTVADVDGARVALAVDRLGATAVAPDEILGAETDILAPCALGAVLNAATIPALRTAAVVGGANNQLAGGADGVALHRRGILYAPDYVVNAGGVVRMCGEYLGWSTAEVDGRVEAIGERLATVFARSAASGLPPHEVADQMAEANFGRA